MRDIRFLGPDGKPVPSFNAVPAGKPPIYLPTEEESAARTKTKLKEMQDELEVARKRLP